MTAIAERVRTQSLMMSSVQRSTNDVLEIVLTAPDGSTLPPWEPGAHVDLTVPSGSTRQYSLCSDPADLGSYRIAVRRCADGRGGSVELHALAAVGTSVEVSLPRNTFPLVDAPRYVLVAGGIGMTALLAMARRLDTQRADTSLLYIGRGRMPLLDEVGALRQVGVTTVDTTQRGRPDLAAFLADAGSAAVYACGPESLLADVTAACDDVLPAYGLHLERFATAANQAGTAFQVELARSGASIAVDASTSVLDALRDAGIDAPSSCEQGICGTCETRVLCGTIEHRDDILTDAEKAEGETMMICVSRCTSGRLVLDL
jgi:ferredoxin-NADP reductase